MSINSSIKCRVESCKFHDATNYCTKQDIVVGKDCACANECCETECLSFECE